MQIKNTGRGKDLKYLSEIECANNNWSTRELDRHVKYTLPEGNKHIFASRYKLYLSTEEELKAEIQRERAMLQIEAEINGKEEDNSK